MNFRVGRVERAGRLLCLFIAGMWVTCGTSCATGAVSRDEKGRLMDATVASLGEALPREELLARMERVMGKFPGAERRCDLDVKVLEEVDCGPYVRKFLTYESEAGGTV